MSPPPEQAGREGRRAKEMDAYRGVQDRVGGHGSLVEVDTRKLFVGHDGEEEGGGREEERRGDGGCLRSRREGRRPSALSPWARQFHPSTPRQDETHSGYRRRAIQPMERQDGVSHPSCRPMAVETVRGRRVQLTLAGEPVAYDTAAGGGKASKGGKGRKRSVGIRERVERWSGV